MGVLARRPEDWVRRLNAAIAAGRNLAFAWGGHDCCMAACTILEAMTGCDPGVKLRRYKTKAGAARVLAKEAASTAPAERLGAVAARLTAGAGLEPIAPAYAQRGDLVLFWAETPDGETAQALGIIDMSGLYFVAPAPAGGWTRCPISAAIAAWHVP